MKAFVQFSQAFPEAQDRSEAKKNVKERCSQNYKQLCFLIFYEFLKPA